MINPDLTVEKLVALPLAELHTAILERQADHPDLAQAIERRIAAIPRLPLGKDGRWWHYPNSLSYPFGN